MIYLVTLGRTIPLCLAEFQALLKINQIDCTILQEIGTHVMVEISGDADANDLLKQSGGVVKISRQMTVGQDDSKTANWENHLQEIITDEEIKTGNYKNFGVSLVGFQDNVAKICEDLKKDLKMHYILPKDGHELSSAQINNKNVLEIVIVKSDREYMIFHTLAVQNIDFWTKKDTGRPFIDDRLGMLPLKVARMMVNIGKGDLEGRGGRDEGIVILDAFCGMGSILEEAIDLGINNVIAVDINPQVLKKCEQNLQWFCQQFMYQHTNMVMINSDAVKISARLKEKVDLIVTEPFLGDAKKILTDTNKYYQILTNTNKNNINIRKNPLAIRVNPNDNKQKVIPKNIEIELKNIMKGLEKMYLGCLKDWKKVLKDEAVVVIIVPEIELGKQVFTIPFVEICGKVGYNIVSSYDYHREKAIVKRKIYVMKIKA